MLAMNSQRVKCLLAALVCLAALGFVARASAQNTALLLFGGEDHKTFLGCLNCSKFSDESVCNKFGSYGSKFEDNSIWNRFGTYGSKFSEYSPWNKFSTSAPVIVDSDGNSYGYFSSNKFHHDRTRIKGLLEILDFESEEQDLDKTRDAMCSD